MDNKVNKGKKMNNSKCQNHHKRNIMDKTDHITQQSIDYWKVQAKKELAETYIKKITRLKEQNKKLVDALDKLAHLGGIGGQLGNSKGNVIAQAALSENGEIK